MCEFWCDGEREEIGGIDGRGEMELRRAAKHRHGDAEDGKGESVTWRGGTNLVAWAGQSVMAVPTTATRTQATKRLLWAEIYAITL